jgi:solute carrier family 25 protein 39/40
MHGVCVDCFPVELGSAIRTAIRQGGVTTLWQGLGPSLLRDVPFSGRKKFEIMGSRTRFGTFGPIGFGVHE